ncbi:MAG: hypothetical protein D6775_03270 [Caldilineae bacterium]|nr:MAG: hypothetical protein D6775_03270 [Caldilineae bacterium]
MAKVEIDPGICGLPTTVRAEMDPDTYRCRLSIESECAAIRKMAEDLQEVDPFQEIALRRGDGPLTLRKGHEYCSHSACPVPVGIIKAVEVAAGLALPADVSMKISKDDD